MRRRLIITGVALVAVAAIAAAVLYFWPPAMRFVRSVVPGLALKEEHKEPDKPPEAIMPESEQPFALVRRLQLVQDSIVEGDKAASQQQDDLLNDIAKSIATAPPSAWRDGRNLRALAPYLLNGGFPQPVRRLLGRKIDLGAMDKPILALLAFAERQDDAAALLEPLDPLKLPRSVGAAVALAKAISLQADPAKAKPYLRMAQLLAPGTVIDEGALRREVSLLIAEKKKPEAVARATRYVWRFGRSIYSSQLESYLATNVLPEIATKDDAKAKMDRYIEEIPADERRKMLLDMARDSVLKARFDTVSVINERAREAARSVPDAENRAAMYYAISKALSREPGAAVDALLGVDRTMLSPQDLGLLDATLALVKRVREPPVVGMQAFDPATGASSVILAAQAAVARADQALLEIRP